MPANNDSEDDQAKMTSPQLPQKRGRSEARMLRSEDAITSAPPLLKGCGQCIITQWRNRGGRMTRGNPLSGWPSGKLRNTNHNVCCGSFSSSHPLIPPLTLPSGQKEHPQTLMIRGDTTRSDTTRRKRGKTGQRKVKWGGGGMMKTKRRKR